MNIRKILSAFDISASGMRAQRRRMDAISLNLANIETTRTENGEPFRRRVVRMSAEAEGGTFAQVFSGARHRLYGTNQRHITEVRSGGMEGQPALPVKAEVSTLQQNAFRLVYDPDHPDADANGYVRYPNINVVTEMVDMISASRGYEANATAIEANKSMAKKALEI
ncbi:MAG TPA: flagellar basal body rod protein FlgC [Bacteroidetes bacterium]|nr:flagellar basal body rod protein FlgC [Bacteroidota bacterium]